MATKPNTDIRNATKALKEVMIRELAAISETLVDDLMKKYKTLKPAQRINATKKVKIKGAKKYKSTLLKALSALALDQLEKAKKGAPKTLKLSLPTEFKKLPPDLQKKLKAQLDLTVDAQMASMEKDILFQYVDSHASTDSESLIRQDLDEAAEDFVTGSVVAGGASAISAKTVNEARTAFFFQKDTLDEIEAFRFVNGDPVSPICQDLAGKVFAKDDPDMFRYTPPLHFNCKSFIEPIYAGELKGREVGKLRPSKESLNKYVQFSEHQGCC